MREALPLAFDLGGGVLLGSFFYGGLWLTIQWASRPGASVLAFPASLLLRTGVAMLGIYGIGRGGGWALCACLLGFGLARFGVGALVRARCGHVPASVADRVPQP